MKSWWDSVFEGEFRIVDFEFGNANCACGATGDGGPGTEGGFRIADFEFGIWELGLGDEVRGRAASPRTGDGKVPLARRRTEDGNFEIRISKFQILTGSCGFGNVLRF